MAVPLRTLKWRLQSRQRLAGFHDGGIGGTAIRAAPLLRPALLLKPLFGGVVVGETPKQLDDGQTFSVVFSGCLVLLSFLHHG